MIAQAVPVPDNTYKLVDERGRTLGRIVAPRAPLDRTPPEDTVFLQRTGRAETTTGEQSERRRPESNR